MEADGAEEGGGGGTSERAEMPRLLRHTPVGTVLAPTVSPERGSESEPTPAPCRPAGLVCASPRRPAPARLPPRATVRGDGGAAVEEGEDAGGGAEGLHKVAVEAARVHVIVHGRADYVYCF